MYKKLVQYIISRGDLCSIWDGNLYQIENSRDYKKIIRAIELTEECLLYIISPIGNREITRVYIVPFENQTDETIYDYYESAYIDDFWKAVEDHTI